MFRTVEERQEVGEAEAGRQASKQASRRASRQAGRAGEQGWAKAGRLQVLALSANPDRGASEIDGRRRRDRERDLGCTLSPHSYNVLGRSAFSYPHTGIQGESLPAPSRPNEPP